MVAFDKLRQFLYPKELRITVCTPDKTLLRDINELISTLQVAGVSPAGPSDEVPATDDKQSLFFAEIGTGLWRMRRKLTDPSTDAPYEETRKAYRHLEALMDTLSHAGIVIQDLTGSRYNTGMSLKVIAFQPVPDMQEEKIIETIKPSIYYRDNPIQTGEVIVGTP